jgi:hypothetical protein
MSYNQDIKENKMIEFNETIWSAAKRKDMKMLLGEILTQLGLDEAVEEVNKTTRWTVAAVDRIAKLVESDPRGDVDEETNDVEESDKAIDPTELDYADNDVEENNELIETEKKVRKAIDNGDHKKAKKAYKKLEALGLGGSVMKDLKKAIKAIK